MEHSASENEATILKHLKHLPSCLGTGVNWDPIMHIESKLAKEKHQAARPLCELSELVNVIRRNGELPS